MNNLQIQVRIMETIILFIKTITKGSKSLLQVATYIHRSQNKKKWKKDIETTWTLHTIYRAETH